GYVVWLSPGPHRVELFVGTENARSTTLEIVAGETIEIATDAHAERSPIAQPAVAAPSVSRPTTTQPSWTLTWIGVGATVASVGVPVLLYAVASGKRADANALGIGNSTYADARSTFQTWRTLYYASYALPATLAVSTVIYMLFHNRDVVAAPRKNGGVHLSV